MRIYKVLLIGESWMIQTTETKGFDTFSVSYYDVGTKYIKSALAPPEFEFVHMPCHAVSHQFPEHIQELQEYDAIIISDVGANTFLLPSETFLSSRKSINKLQLIKDYVISGGGLCMAGGYLSFMGIEGKGKYFGSILETVLPVDFLSHDDRVEHPEGVEVAFDNGKHPILFDLDSPLSGILGYNASNLKAGCTKLLDVNGSPLLAVGMFGNGRSVAYASDLAPHWATPEFCESATYEALWRNIVKWLAKAI